MRILMFSKKSDHLSIRLKRLTIILPKDTNMVHANVYESNDSNEVVARVQYNQALDKRGCNKPYHCYNDKEGFHAGLTKLKRSISKKSFVLISGSDYQYPTKAWLITDEEALSEILKSENDNLLKKYFPNYQQSEEE